MNYIKMIKEVPLWNSGYCQLWDFSLANSCKEARIEAVTHVANVCRGDKGVKNPEELYGQLLTEHNGKAGSVFEFVPVKYKGIINVEMSRFGVSIEETPSEGRPTERGFLTNLRALLPYKEPYTTFNESAEGFFVFKVKVPQMIVKHILRHRMLSFQECSERTNKLREYYYCDELKGAITHWGNMRHDPILQYSTKLWNKIAFHFGQCQWDEIQKQYKIRQELLNKGSHGLAYTTMWVAGWKQDLNGYQNLFDVRCATPTQKEMIELTATMKQMMEEYEN